MSVTRSKMQIVQLYYLAQRERRFISKQVRRNNCFLLFMQQNKKSYVVTVSGYVQMQSISICISLFKLFYLETF